MIKGKNVYVIIPARGGSKAIPKKNIIEFDGLPLIGHSILYAKKSDFIDEIFVSTDSDEIEKISKKFDVSVIKRPENISLDDSSTELTIEHVIKSQNIDSDSIIILLQPTSPIRPEGKLNLMLENFLANNYDSMVSISPCHPLNWKLESADLICRYNYKDRPMRQEFKKEDYIYDENGSVYIFTQKLFDLEKNRLGGKIGYEIFPEEYSYQIDTYLDLEILKAIASYLKNEGKNV
tara:strand:+ start:3866 stop:4570 length:705 start_codon:yes stop_codon:yes gene_type:complete